MAATAWRWARSVGRWVRPSRPIPAPDRPGTDQHHLAARLQHVMQLVGKLGNPLLVELPVVTRQDAGADLDDDRVAVAAISWRKRSVMAAK